MKEKITENALEKVAQKEGISVEEVKREIEFAIAAAFSNPDPTIQDRWKDIPREGQVPTPEELIAHIAKNIRS